MKFKNLLYHISIQENVSLTINCGDKKLLFTILTKLDTNLKNKNY